MNSPEVAAPVTTPADVVHAVRMFERDGQVEMHIGVRSEALGTIDVKATVHDGNVGVSIGVERHEARSALVSELPGLENTLRERDLRLGEVRFHDTGSTLASDYGSGQQRQSQEFSRPPASAFYRAAKSSSGSNELPVEMVTTIARRGISVHV
jgi:flagellar hook-length control protein FliK